MQLESRKSGIDKIGDVPFGTHICQFYQTKEDLLTMLAPYFKAGLESNEFCMWVVSPPLGVEEAAGAMRKSIPDFERFLEKEQIEIISYDQWYLRDGAFESKRVLDSWIDKHNQARSRGFDGLRLAGNTSWLDKDTWRDFTEYEQEVDGAMRNYNMLAICTYSLDQCHASEIIDVIKNHESALIMRAGKWEVIQSSGRKRIEQELQESEEIYRTLVETSPDSIAMIDLDGRILKANRQAATLVGCSNAEELIGKSARSFLTSEYDKDFHDRAEEMQEDKTIGTIDAVVVRKDGTVVVTENNSSVIYDRDGNPKAIMSVTRDVTERKRAEEALRESEEVYRLLVETSPNAITMSGLDGKILRANSRAADMLGLENKEELIGRSGYDLVVPEEREEFQKRLLASFKDGISDEIEFTFIGKEGKRRTGEFMASILADAQGQPRAVMTTVRDITEHKQTEMQLRSLASELSLAEERERRRIATELHDNVGQILAAAKMKLGTLPGQFSSTELEGAVGNVKRLCEQAIEFTRSLTLQLSPPVLYELGLEAAVEWLAGEYGKEHGIQIGFATDREPKPLDEDIRVLLFQSIRELLNNVVRHARVGEAKVSLGREAERIRIAIEDNGIGFDASELKGGGGFGLFNIKERLSCMGGTFSLESSPGQGTRVVLTAPLKNDVDP